MPFANVPVEFWLTLLAASVPVVLFYAEIRVRNLILKKELAIKERQQEMEEKIFHSNLDRTEAIASEMSDRITKNLTDDPTWAFKALDRAKYFPYTKIFGERSSHFAKEKDSMATEFSKLLCDRLLYLKKEEGYSKFVIFMDAGTTVYAVFRDVVALLRTSKYKQIDVEIITNNLPGVQSVIRRANADDEDYPEPVAKTYMVPGEILPEFASVTGAQAVRYIEERLQEHKSISRLRGSENRTKTISILTGNWIRVMGNQEGIPIPMARGRGHLDVKRAAFQNTDEVYIIGPLGKIVKNIDLDEFNKLLRTGGLGYSGGDKYEEIDPIGGSHKIRLVSTRRYDNSIMSAHFGGVKLAVGDVAPISDINMAKKFSSIQHMFFDYEIEAKSQHEQLREEVPHPRLHDPNILSRLFDINI